MDCYATFKLDNHHISLSSLNVRPPVIPIVLSKYHPAASSLCCRSMKITKRNSLNAYVWQQAHQLFGHHLTVALSFAFFTWWRTCQNVPARELFGWTVHLQTDYKEPSRRWTVENRKMSCTCNREDTRRDSATATRPDRLDPDSILPRWTQSTNKGCSRPIPSPPSPRSSIPSRQPKSNTIMTITQKENKKPTIRWH